MLTASFLVLYYITVKASLAQKTKKLFGGFFGFKTFLTVFLIALFFNIGIVKAQAPGPVSVNFDEFICLFTKTDNNGKCVHNPDEANVKTGAESGVVYGKTNTFTDKGVTSITMQMGLWLDVAKEIKEKKYHFSRVADDRSQTFLLRLKYEPVAGYPIYKLIDIPYQEDNVEAFGNARVRTINMDLTKGSPQIKIGFYKLGPSGPETVTQQVINAVVDTKVNSSTVVEIPFGATISADFWYCGGEKKGSSNIDGRYAPRDGERVEYFTTDGRYTDIRGSQTGGISYGVTKCDGTAYFKIGKTIDFKLPESKEAAQIDSQKQLDSGIVSSEYLGSVLPLCSIDPFTNGSVMGCVAQILYGGVFRPVAFFAQLMGNIFDFFLGYSLSDESYRHDFVQTGWQLVRDISNIFFIIIMIWSGLVAIFDTKKASYKTVIPTLIINALIINFSLFATRVVIDLSNITARIFYNQMVVKVDGEIAPSSSGFKPISEAIVSSFNPQSIFRNSVLQSEDLGSDTESSSATTADFNSQSKNQTEGAKFKRYSREYASYFALVTLIAIMISFSVAIMFWKTAFIFIGRVVGLYIAMIFSPFAFLSRGKLPLVGNIPGINYSAWWKDLTQYALLAPIFVFFLYIINAFLNVEFFTKVGLDQNGQGFFGSVMYVLIPMLIIYGLVTKGVDVAKRFSGSLGEMAQKFGTRATGVGVGLASGGLAFAGRNVVGRGLGLIGNSKTGRMIELDGRQVEETRAMRWAQNAPDSRLSRMWNNTYNRAQTGSWDARNINKSVYNKISSTLGLSDKISNQVGLGEDAGVGGNIAINKKLAEAKQKDLENQLKLSHLSDEQSKAAWQAYRDKKLKKSEIAWEENIDSDSSMKPHIEAEKKAKEETKIAEEKLKEARATNDTLIITQAQTDLQNKKDTQKDAEEKTKKEREQLIKDIKEGNHDKKEAVEAAVEKERKRLDKYGKVKDNKSFTNAMRAEYIEDLQKTSFWGDYLSGAAGSTAKAKFFSSIMNALIPGVGIVMAPLLAKELAEGLVDGATGARAKAMKAILDKAKKASGKDSPLAKLEAKISEHQQKIIKAVNKALGKDYKDHEYDKLSDSDDLEEGLTRREADLQDEIDTLGGQINNLTGQAKKDALYRQQKSKNMLNSLRNAIKDLEQANKNLNDFKDKQKEKDDREAEKKKST